MTERVSRARWSAILAAGLILACTCGAYAQATPAASASPAAVPAGPAKASGILPVPAGAPSEAKTPPIVIPHTTSASPTTRVRDVAHLSGTNSNPLVGYGMVMGLQGTGDTQGTINQQMVTRMLQTLGMNFPAENTQDTTVITIKNTAMVMMTAELSPYARPGDPLDVTVSSMGDAKSLQGGVLVLSMLRGADGQIFATAQGPVQVGHPEVSGLGLGPQGAKPTVTSGLIPQGGLVIRQSVAAVEHSGVLTWVLNRPDFDVASRIANAVTAYLPGLVASARNAETVEVSLADYASEGPVVDTVARIGNVPLELPAVTPTGPVMFNSRQGVVLRGGDVRLRPGFAQDGSTRIQVGSDDASATVQALVKNLRKLGVPPPQCAEILRTLQKNAILPADLTIL